jgi:hypothetical protein
MSHTKQRRATPGPCHHHHNLPPAVSSIVCASLACAQGSGAQAVRCAAPAEGSTAVAGGGVGCERKAILEFLTTRLPPGLASHLQHPPPPRTQLSGPQCIRPFPTHLSAAFFMGDWGRPLRRPASTASPALLKGPPPACSPRSTALSPTSSASASAPVKRPRLAAATKLTTRHVAALSRSSSSSSDDDSDSRSSSAAATQATISIATLRSCRQRASTSLPACVTGDASRAITAAFDDAHLPSQVGLTAASVALAIASRQPVSREQLEALPLLELREICKSHGVKVHGCKADVVIRLLCFFAKRSRASGHRDQLNVLSTIDLRAFCHSEGLPPSVRKSKREEIIAHLLQLAEGEMQLDNDGDASSVAIGVVELRAAVEQSPAGDSSAPSQSFAIDTPALLSPSTPCSLSGSSAAAASAAADAAPRISSARRRLSSPQPNASATAGGGFASNIVFTPDPLLNAALFKHQTSMALPLDHHPQQLASGAVADGVAATSRTRPTHLPGGGFVRGKGVYSQQKIMEAKVKGDAEFLKR